MWISLSPVFFRGFGCDDLCSLSFFCSMYTYRTYIPLCLCAFVLRLYILLLLFVAASTCCSKGWYRSWVCLLTCTIGSGLIHVGGMHSTAAHVCAPIDNNCPFFPTVKSFFALSPLLCGMNETDTLPPIAPIDYVTDGGKPVPHRRCPHCQHAEQPLRHRP